MINFDRIVENVFVGTCPGTAVDVMRLSQAGMTAVFSLQTDQDFRACGINWPALEKEYLQREIACYRYPIIDFNDDDMTERLYGATALLEEVTGQHGRVYVHCTAGQQRAPSTVIGWLAWQQSMNLETAIETVLEARRCAPPLHVIRAVDQLNQRFKPAV